MSPLGSLNVILSFLDRIVLIECKTAVSTSSFLVLIIFAEEMSEFRVLFGSLSIFISLYLFVLLHPVKMFFFTFYL